MNNVARWVQRENGNWDWVDDDFGIPIEFATVYADDDGTWGGRWSVSHEGFLVCGEHQSGDDACLAVEEQVFSRGRAINYWLESKRGWYFYSGSQKVMRVRPTTHGWYVIGEDGRRLGRHLRGHQDIWRFATADDAAEAVYEEDEGMAWCWCWIKLTPEMQELYKHSPPKPYTKDMEKAAKTGSGSWCWKQ
jgi:hypothetical protein